jgi:hypothetical protein
MPECIYLFSYSIEANKKEIKTKEINPCAP